MSEFRIEIAECTYDPIADSTFLNRDDVCLQWHEADTMKHTERHRTHRIGWLRAAVLGANDGIVSTSSLLVGVVAANASQATVLMTGVASLVAGAMSMAAGEYVSVHSQADTEKADLARESAELGIDPDAELRELTAIYAARGLPQELASQVAVALTAHDALGAHARDELGISDAFSAKPLQAALSSAASFAVGAALPLGVAALVPAHSMMAWITSASLLSLAVLGVVAARAGGAKVLASVWRVTFWGLLAMAATAGVGRLFGAAI
jgi:VIT1/CCC1 family predicted Fe2+/Mn2+ transporter